jgi:hypothetical protein
VSIVGSINDGIVGPSVGSSGGGSAVSAPITFVGAAATNWSTGSGSESFASPPGVLPNDLVLVFLTHRNSVVALPTGGSTFIEKTHWSVKPTTIVEDNSENDRCYIWYKVAGSEPANYAVSYTDSGADGAAVVTMAFRSATTVGIYVAASSQVAPTITMEEGDTLVSWHGTVFNSSSDAGITVPSGMTLADKTYNATGDVGIAAAYLLGQSAGASGTKAWGGGWTNYEIGGNILIR